MHDAHGVSKPPPIDERSRAQEQRRAFEREMDQQATRRAGVKFWCGIGLLRLGMAFSDEQAWALPLSLLAFGVCGVLGLRDLFVEIARARAARAHLR